MSEAQDVISLRGLSAVGKHGVFEFERSGSQVFTADLTLWVDASRAVETDDVQYTVSYAEIADAAVEILTGPPVYLIETLAHRLVHMVLQNPLVKKVEVTVHKPMAPVGHLFDDVSVTMVRDSSQVLTPTAEKKVSSQVPPQLTQFVAEPPSPPTKGSSRLVLALGSNQGDSVRILSAAVGALIEAPGIEVDDVSPLVVSEPVLASGQTSQPNYYNAVVLARTVLEPQQVLHLTQSIEAQFGRIRTEKWGPRTLDIDLIDVGGKHVSTDELTLPHPRAATRAFVLYPWSMVASDALLDGEPVAQLARRAEDFSGLKSVTEDWLVETAPEAPTQVKPAEPAKTTAGEGVVVRGSSLRLADAGGDNLFRRLVEADKKPAPVQKSTRPAVVEQPAATPSPKPTKPVAFPKRRAATELPAAKPAEKAIFPKRQSLRASEPAVAAEPTSHAAPPPTQPVPVAAASQRTARELPDLPSWRFLHRQDDVRIVDSVDSGAKEEAPAASPESEPQPRWARIIRPTPTGMISLNGPAEGGNGDGGA